MKISTSRIFRRDCSFHLLVAICLMGCGTNDMPTAEIEHTKSQDSLIARVPAAAFFYQYSRDFEEIVTQLSTNSLIDKNTQLTVLKPGDFSIELANKMRGVGITKLIYYTMYCDSLVAKNSTLFEFDFTTNWDSKTPVHVNKEACVNDYNKLGDYNKRDNGNELWGLGDNWVIWYEHFPTSK